MQWIRERNAKQREININTDFKTPEDFRNLISRLEKLAPKLIESLVASYLASDEPHGFKLLQELLGGKVPRGLDDDMVMTLVCAHILWKDPHLEGWSKVKEIAYNSWQVENWLSEAMIAFAERDIAVKDAYIRLATSLFEALDRDELSSKSVRKTEARERSLASWRNAEHKLDEIWWQLRGSDFTSYEEMRTVSMLCELSPSTFQKLLGGAKNPYLVDAALWWAGKGAVGLKFSQWEELVRSAPVAFDADGKWTGSVLLPLLLVHARNEILASGSNLPRYGGDQSEVESITTEVAPVVHSVVATLAMRSDAPAVFSRWATWLVHQLLLQGWDEFDDIRSSVFVDKKLLIAISKVVAEKKLPPAPYKYGASWEAWCYQGALSFFAAEDSMPPPSFEDFSVQWALTPEDWAGEKGQDLLAHARVHLARDAMPSMSAHLLAYPLSSRDDFAIAWQQLWDRAYHLREVLEFGSVDAGEQRYSSQTDASRLLLVLGGIGLACFEQVVTRSAQLSASLAHELIRLHRVVTVAVIEVLQLDNTINRDRWRTLLQHLALRRIYFDRAYTRDNSISVFGGEEKPSISYFIKYLQADPADLIAFLHACMENKLDASTLRDEIHRAQIDLRSCVDSVSRLNALRSQKYPLNVGALKAIAPLMN